MGFPLKIAVSGVAGAAGYGGIQCARLLPYPVEVYPVDVKSHSLGLFLGDHDGTVLPKPELHIEAWVDFMRENEIDALIPGADRDLMPLAEHRVQTRALVSDPFVIAVADDKLKTARYLRTAVGIPVPKFAHPDDADMWDEFPCVVKPRSDAASRGFHICHDRAEMYFYLNRLVEPMIQEYIDGDEVTANVFVDSDGEPVARLAMLRKDRAGIGIETRPIEDDAVHEMLDKIGRALRPRGTLSVQLKLRAGVPLPFEINARMSGSSIVRATAGYNDLGFLLDHYVLGKPIMQPKVDYTQTYFRYYGVYPVATERLQAMRSPEMEMI